MIMEFALAALLGGIGRRIAGGLLNQWFARPGDRVVGDTPARLLFGLLVAAFPALHDPWLALYLPGIWLGSTIGNFGSIGMGRGSDPYWRSFCGLTLHGVAGIALPALTALYTGHTWWPLLVSGLTIAPLYTLAWGVTGHAGVRPPWPPGLNAATEIGEFLWGAAVGAAALLSGAG